MWHCLAQWQGDLELRNRDDLQKLNRALHEQHADGTRRNWVYFLHTEQKLRSLVSQLVLDQQICGIRAVKEIIIIDKVVILRFYILVYPVLVKNVATDWLLCPWGGSGALVIPHSGAEARNQKQAVLSPSVPEHSQKRRVGAISH